VTELASHSAVRRIVVVGGANTDIVGLPDGPLVMRDSNPGHARTSAGGVARNIAENLARLGIETHLVTVFGGDVTGRALASECEAAGVHIGGSLIAEDLPGARYVAILDERGDLALALSDMRALERLTPESLATPERAELLASADLVVADTNLKSEALAYLAEHVTAPLVLDPVSVAKAPRLLGVLDRLAAIKPSAAEAGELLGTEIRNRDHAREAAVELVARGVGAAFVTFGPFGAAWADAAGSGFAAAPATDVVNATGAGDAFCAGIAWALLAARPAEDAARAGTSMASLTLGDESTVSERVSAGELARLLGRWE